MWCWDFQRLVTHSFIFHGPYQLLHLRLMDEPPVPAAFPVLQLLLGGYTAVVFTAISLRYFSLSDYASDALTRKPIDRSCPNFANILSIGWRECLQNLSQIGLLVRKLGRQWYNSWDKNSCVLFQWSPKSRTNKPIWLKFCRHSLQPIDRICAKFGSDRSIGSRVRASLT